MGATSVTGTGPGAAHAGVKGPHNGRDFFVPQITPHIIAAGTVALAAGTATVTFANPLSGSETGYVVHVTSEGTGNAAVTTKTDNSDGNFASFVITGTGTDSVMWMVANAGMGLNA